MATGPTERTALSMSQSLKMMRGDFPPSSRDTFFTLLTAQLQEEQEQEQEEQGERGEEEEHTSLPHITRVEYELMHQTLIFQADAMVRMSWTHTATIWKSGIKPSSFWLETNTPRD